MDPPFAGLRQVPCGRGNRSGRSSPLLRRQTITRWIGRSWARLSYSHFVEPIWLESNEIELEVAAPCPALAGLRILHLTDFHLCDRVPVAHIRQAIELGRRLQCDLVALTGDFVHAGFRHVEAAAHLLGRLSAPLGVYAVLGNHDYSVRNAMGVRRYPRLPETICTALENVGVQMVQNTHRVLERHGASFAVCGVADLWSRECRLAETLDAVPANLPRVVLSHNPASVELLEGRRCELMLSGHTHGGQILVPRLGPAMLSAKMRDYAAGLYRIPTGYLYVNKGVGYTVRFRYKVRPEVAVLKFREVKVDAL